MNNEVVPVQKRDGFAFNQPSEIFWFRVQDKHYYPIAEAAIPPESALGLMIKNNREGRIPVDKDKDNDAFVLNQEVSRDGFEFVWSFLIVGERIVEFPISYPLLEEVKHVADFLHLFELKTILASKPSFPIPGVLYKYHISDDRYQTLVFSNDEERALCHRVENDRIAYTYVVESDRNKIWLKPESERDVKYSIERDYNTAKWMLVLHQSTGINKTYEIREIKHQAWWKKK